MRELECEKVIFVLPDREIVIENPQVTLLEVQGEKLYQVAGREVERYKEELHTKGLEITEEDVRLVAEQANVNLEEARKALEETGGDLAQAIILLQARKG
ncbi:MAG: nascent polypeptide-associated complex protein [Thermofilaceae archaeon]|nr:nascent polypeptide-associated complex protein [Thermofilaceae archaeon]MCX8180608.1 nascent polypeptide-associated complex protein [Thermofilaceae archaeon]MDW8003710.1 nascent polypeptide-associated complex protein [Thermofilaceae archaeon]MDW8004998.1 nascent polypeptide-associated complex protein [Thermofilaceae archaeon]